MNITPGCVIPFPCDLLKADIAKIFWRIGCRGDEYLSCCKAVSELIDARFPNPTPAPLPAIGTTETPRVDGALIDKLTCSEGGDEECTVYPAEEIVDADFARTLEKELAQAKATIAGLEAKLEAGETKTFDLIQNGLERQEALEADRVRLKAELEEAHFQRKKASEVLKLVTDYAEARLRASEEDTARPQ